jgi:hypothetical protein
VKLEIRHVPSQRLRKSIAESNAYKCAFPGCTQELLIDEAFIGEIASIEALNSNGPRYNAKTDNSVLNSEENYLLLCPNHHRIIDRQPEIYTAEWLKKARADHLGKIKSILNGGNSAQKFSLASQIELSLSDAMQVWKGENDNNVEEFWQELFDRCPSVISQMFPRSMIKYGSKCYVGGKSIQNTHGNLVDFVYASTSTNNIVLVEIKTPTTALIGKKYRQNSYSMSDELSGSIVQVLNYRDSLIKEYYSLSRPGQEAPFSAFSPKCVVISGNVSLELDTPIKLKSFELFRSALAGVDVVGYDELFEKVQCVLDVAK